MNDIDKSSVVKSLNRNLYANVGNQTPLTIATLKAAYADGIEQAIADGKTKAAAKIASHADWVTSLRDEDFGDYLKFKLIAEKLYKGEPLENRQKAFLNDVKEDAVQKLLDNTMTSSRDTAGVDR
jgi:aldehyde:ferredoxin oxidoreductase